MKGERRVDPITRLAGCSIHGIAGPLGGMGFVAPGWPPTGCLRPLKEIAPAGNSLGRQQHRIVDQLADRTGLSENSVLLAKSRVLKRLREEASDLLG